MAGLNTVLAVTAAQELVLPAFTDDGGTAVGFFDKGKLQFCIPTANEAECASLAIRIQSLVVKAIARYVEIENQCKGATQPNDKAWQQP